MQATTNSCAKNQPNQHGRRALERPLPQHQAVLPAWKTNRKQLSFPYMAPWFSRLVVSRVSPLGQRRSFRRKAAARRRCAAALVSRHFPDRLHEFVWRTGTQSEPAKLAKILGASAQEVNTLAVSMDCLRIPKCPRAEGARLRHLIRTELHLLPYEQLLELLRMTPERLDVMLREEDLLWVKLGR